MTSNTHHEKYIRRAIELSLQARATGDHPFGALLVHNDQIVCEDFNRVHTNNDSTRHAELNLCSKANQTLSKEIIAQCTLYTSCEPCCMCSGAIFWSGFNHVVFGLSHDGLFKICQAAGSEGGLLMPCKSIFEQAQGRKVQVTGPVLEDEAAKAHDGFWQQIFK